MNARSVMTLDVGERRIGVALANRVARLASPLTTLENNTAVYEKIAELIHAHDADALVIGLPRGMQGQQTGQTTATEAFAANLREHITVPVYFMDEAVTSQMARAELKARGSHIHKGDIDALAATYILEDYLREQGADI